MSSVDEELRDLVIANRVLSNEGVVDAYGHLSVRNPEAPERFFLSHSLAPEFVGFDDILEFRLDGRAGERRQADALHRAVHSQPRSTRRARTSRPWCTHTPRTRCRSASRSTAGAGDPLRRVHRRRGAGMGHRRATSATRPTCWSPTSSRAPTWRAGSPATTWCSCAVRLRRRRGDDRRCREDGDLPAAQRPRPDQRPEASVRSNRSRPARSRRARAAAVIGPIRRRRACLAVLGSASGLRRYAAVSSLTGWDECTEPGGRTMLSDARKRAADPRRPGHADGRALPPLLAARARSATELPAPDCTPVRMRVLGEKPGRVPGLAGRVGVLDERCPHRLASLFWGRNEEGGLRCVYHGWKWDVEGRCLDVPNTPEGETYKDKVAAFAAYPAVERGGLVWAYMGPSERCRRCRTSSSTPSRGESLHLEDVHQRQLAAGPRGRHRLQPRQLPAQPRRHRDGDLTAMGRRTGADVPGQGAALGDQGHRTTASCSRPSAPGRTTRCTGASTSGTCPRSR